MKKSLSYSANSPQKLQLLKELIFFSSLMCLKVEKRFITTIEHLESIKMNLDSILGVVQSRILESFKSILFRGSKVLSLSKLFIRLNSLEYFLAAPQLSKYSPPSTSKQRRYPLRNLTKTGIPPSSCEFPFMKPPLTPLIASPFFNK